MEATVTREHAKTCTGHNIDISVPKVLGPSDSNPGREQQRSEAEEFSAEGVTDLQSGHDFFDIEVVEWGHQEMKVE